MTGPLPSISTEHVGRVGQVWWDGRAGSGERILMDTGQYVLRIPELA